MDSGLDKVCESSGGSFTLGGAEVQSSLGTDLLSEPEESLEFEINRFNAFWGRAGSEVENKWRPGSVIVAKVDFLVLRSDFQSVDGS